MNRLCMGLLVVVLQTHGLPSVGLGGETKPLRQSAWCLDRSSTIPTHPWPPCRSTLRRTTTFSAHGRFARPTMTFPAWKTSIAAMSWCCTRDHLTISGEQLERVRKYCQSGKPIVGIRTASHAFQNWLALDKEIFGGNYKNHFGKGSLTDIQIVDKAKDHPILAGFKPFKSEGTLYKNTGLAPDCDVLLTGTIPGQFEPIAWTRLHKGGRIFYTSLGHQKDFEEENFIRLIANASYWTTTAPRR